VQQKIYDRFIVQALDFATANFLPKSNVIKILILILNRLRNKSVTHSAICGPYYKHNTIINEDLSAINNGSFTLVKFVSKTISDSVMKQYLPWPPWAMRQEIETILSVSRNPRWPRQEQW
jgi:hypothetical protein